MSTCLCNLKKSPEESCKDEIRFLNSLFRKVKGFDWFSLKKRDLITVFKYMQGFYPGPMRVSGQRVLSALRREGTSPGSDKETFLTLRATGHRQAKECSSGKFINGGRVGKKEKDRKWGKTMGRSELCKKQPRRPCQIQILFCELPLCHLALFLDLLNMPHPRVRNLPSNCFPGYPACCSFLGTGLERCSPPCPQVSRAFRIFIERHLYVRALSL